MAVSSLDGYATAHHALLPPLSSGADQEHTPLPACFVTDDECVGCIPDQSLLFRVSCQQDVASEVAWSPLSFLEY